MDITQVTFPLYKIRSYISIEKSILGVVKITTIKGEYILDDTNIPGTFEERRLKMTAKYPKEKIYRLKEQINYLRQLVKYKSGSTFVDYNGNIIKYKKSSNLFEVKSHKIIEIKPYGDNWTIIKAKNIEIPFLIAEPISPKVGYASIMYTKWGPFLYDLTSIQHETYRRKI